MGLSETGKIGRLLLALGVIAVGLFLFAAPAEAHSVHMPEMEMVDAPADADHTAHGHLGHCHGGAFCPGAAVFVAAPVSPEPYEHPVRLAIPRLAQGETAISSFDPPPPRVLI